MKMMQCMRTGLIALACLLLSACSGLLEADRPPEQTWWLEPVTTNAPVPESTGPGLTLEVSAVPGLDTDRILTINDEARLNHFGGARWPDHVPDLLASLMVRSIESSGNFEPVSVRHAPPSHGCHLSLEVRKFFTEVDADNRASSTEIAVAGHFSCDRQSRSVRASSSTRVSGTDMSAVVAAYQQGLDQVTRDLIEQLGSGV